MRVLLRCDAAPEIGIGHVVRCIALAEEALAAGHEVELLGRIEGELPRTLTARATGLRLLGPAPEQPLELARRLDNHDLVHIDAYDVGDLTDVLALCARPPLLSSMHDGAFGLRPSDVAVDPTPGSDMAEPTQGWGWDLRGGRYVPIRRSVLQQAVNLHTTTEAAKGSRVLVVMGGTDPTGSAPYIARALLASGLSLFVTVVAAPHTRTTLNIIAEADDRQIEVIDPVADLASLLARSDLVVTAAGSTVWEVCALARPMAVVLAAENQTSGYNHVVDAGAAVGLGSAADLRNTLGTAALLGRVLGDPQRRTLLARAAHDLVDGLGSWRIVASWEEVVGGASHGKANEVLRMRAVTEEDAETLWLWRNDPSARALSRTSDPIPLERHKRWLSESLARLDRQLMIGRDGTGDVGAIRWDRRAPGEWEVSITVAPERRGQGLAGPLLAAGEMALVQSGEQVQRLLAVVHGDNRRSRRLFTSSGYLPDLPADVEGFGRWSKLPSRPVPRI